MSRTRWEIRKAELPRSVREWAGAGVTATMLRGSGWRRVGRGFYVPTTAEPNTGQRIVDVTSLIGGSGIIGGWAAGYLHGADWLDGRDRDTFAAIPIDCIGPRRLDQPTLRYRLTRLSDDDICIRHGLQVTTPMRTAFDGARWAPSLSEAVVFVDAMATQVGVSLSDLADYVQHHPRMTGVEQARSATRLADPAVMSPWESILRVCYRCEARLPAPLLNVPLFDGDSFLGQPDLFDPEAAFGVEFDGDLHRDREQHRRDNIREEKLESAGVTMARCGSRDLTHHRPGLIGRLRDGHRRGLGRIRSRDRWSMTQPDWWGHR